MLPFWCRALAACLATTAAIALSLSAAWQCGRQDPALEQRMLGTVGHSARLEVPRLPELRPSAEQPRQLWSEQMPTVGYDSEGLSPSSATAMQLHWCIQIPELQTCNLNTVNFSNTSTIAPTIATPPMSPSLTMFSNTSATMATTVPEVAFMTTAIYTTTATAMVATNATTMVSNTSTANETLTATTVTPPILFMTPRVKNTTVTTSVASNTTTAAVGTSVTTRTATSTTATRKVLHMTGAINTTTLTTALAANNLTAAANTATTTATATITVITSKFFYMTTPVNATAVTTAVTTNTTTTVAGTSTTTKTATSTSSTHTALNMTSGSNTTTLTTTTSTSSSPTVAGNVTITVTAQTVTTHTIAFMTSATNTTTVTTTTVTEHNRTTASTTAVSITTSTMTMPWSTVTTSPAPTNIPTSSTAAAPTNVSTNWTLAAAQAMMTTSTSPADPSANSTAPAMPATTTSRVPTSLPTTGAAAAMPTATASTAHRDALSNSTANTTTTPATHVILFANGTTPATPAAFANTTEGDDSDVANINTTLPSVGRNATTATLANSSNTTHPATATTMTTNTTTTTTTIAPCYISPHFPISNGCKWPLENGARCQAGTIDHECIEQGTLTFQCPDLSRGSVAEVDWRKEFHLGDHRGAAASFFIWSGSLGQGADGKPRRNADLVSVFGGFDVKCRVCGFAQPHMQDLDSRKGHVDVLLEFGPNVLNGTVNEDNLSGYAIYLIRTCHKKLSRRLAFIGKARNSYSGLIVQDVCGCPTRAYRARVRADLPATGSKDLRLMVVPVTAHGHEMPMGLTSAVLQDYTTTTTTSRPGGTTAESRPTDTPSTSTTSGFMAEGTGSITANVTANVSVNNTTDNGPQGSATTPEPVPFRTTEPGRGRPVTRITGSMQLDLEGANAEEFVADPQVLVAVTEGIAAMLGVSVEYLQVTLTVVSSRLLRARRDEERRLAGGMVRVDYIITLPTDAPPSLASAESITSKLQATDAASQMTGFITDKVDATVGAAKYTLTVTSMTPPVVQLFWVETTVPPSTSTSPPKMRGVTTMMPAVEGGPGPGVTIAVTLACVFALCGCGSAGRWYWHRNQQLNRVQPVGAEDECDKDPAWHPFETDHDESNETDLRAAGEAFEDMPQYDLKLSGEEVARWRYPLQ